MTEKPLFGDQLLRALAYLVCAGLIGISVFIVYRRTVGSQGVLLWNPYALSEMLINYSGGFVRRGLPGAIIHALAAGRAAAPIANYIIFYNYILLVCGITTLALKDRRATPWNAVFVLLIPGGVFSMAISNQVYFRKEAFLALRSYYSDSL